jgi:hypothetical protein
MDKSGVSSGGDVLQASPGSVAETAPLTVRKIRLLSLRFENNLDFNKLPALRAAVASLAEPPNEWFHHHLPEKKLLYKYPLIQFKLNRGHPSIWAADDGATEVLKLAEHSFPAEVKLYNEKTELQVERLLLKQHVLQVWDKMFTYRIRNWLALNSENYAKYRQMISLHDRLEMLRRLLVAHIISFAEGVKWNVGSTIQLYLNDIHARRLVKFKKVGLMAFDVTFTTNLSLPDGVGLGKAVSVGYGVVTRYRDIVPEDQTKT